MITASLRKPGRSRRIQKLRPFKTFRSSSSSWVWLTGSACVAAAVLLYPAGLKTFLTPFMGHGPFHLFAATPLLAHVLALLAFMLHCAASLALGIAGFLILHRAWHPDVRWTGEENDPPWLQRLFRAYEFASRRALAIAWRGTCLAGLVCIFGLGYQAAGRCLGLRFEIGPDSAYAPYAYAGVLLCWPFLLLLVSNIYAVRSHFLTEPIDVEQLVLPRDVIDLSHELDVTPIQVDLEGETQKKAVALKERLALITASVVRFTQIRSYLLRHRTAEIGHTDVHWTWWSQQALRAYRWGRDPRWSESNAWSFGLHATCILGPLLAVFLTGLFSCKQPFVPPPSKGSPPSSFVSCTLKLPRIVKIPKVHLIINPYAPVIFQTFLDPRVMEIIKEEDYDNPYVSRLKSSEGHPRGKGGHGNSQGTAGEGNSPLPYSLRDGAARFVRLRHNGEDWDRNFGPQGDYQLLKKFHKSTGARIAKSTESFTIEQLASFSPKESPPFVYITGRKKFAISSHEARILKEYLLLRGGMIIADSPGDEFTPCFRSMITSVLGNRQWIDIPDDDPLYRTPELLEGGPPPLWHHDGTRALGIKHQGRWIVFYHPGDLGDAWRIGHSGAPEDTVDAAYKLGVNLISHAINQHQAFHRGKF